MEQLFEKFIPIFKVKVKSKIGIQLIPVELDDYIFTIYPTYRDNFLIIREDAYDETSVKVYSELKLLAEFPEIKLQLLQDLYE